MSDVIKTFQSLVESFALMIGEQSNVEAFDDRKFIFSVFLFNQDNQIVRIRRGAIDELVINDDILDWFHSGHLTFMNPDDVLERAEVIPDETAGMSQSSDTIPYRFRGDGRDFLYIIMEPQLVDDVVYQMPQLKLNNAVHTMRFVFTVYATEDINDERGKKFKKQKLYFHDYRQQQLRERTLYYSTAKNNQNNSNTQTGNTDRGKLTGEIIQDILGAGLVGADVEQKFSRHWDFGSTKMFYTSPCEHKALDDLNYVLDRHISSPETGQGPSILKLERMTERWELLPLSEYFARAVSDNSDPGVYQSEAYKLAFEDTPVTQQTIPPKSKSFPDFLGHSALINYHIQDVSIIDDYVFSEMNGVDCREIINSAIVHRYDEKTKTFNIDVTDGNQSNVYDYFQSNYVSKLKGEGFGGGGVMSWLTNPMSQDNLNIDVVKGWSSNSGDNLSAGRNKKLLGAFLLGNSIQFQVKGHPSRRAGVWITVDRAHDYLDSFYDSKVLGQYFVTRIEHRITPQGYSNNVIGLKPYLFDEPGFTTSDLFYKNPEKIGT